MIYWGINALNHDSSLSVFDNDQLVYSNRSSNNLTIDQVTLEQALTYGKPTKVFWYERPILKKLRQLYAGQYNQAFDLQQLPKFYLSSLGIKAPIVYVGHHHSHAAAAYYTSDVEDAVVLVADAIGEWDTISIWECRDADMRKVYSSVYPYSLGLFYSAFTQLSGMEPVKDEGRFMSLSKTGRPLYKDLVKTYLKENCHIGIRDWPVKDFSQEDLASSVQSVFEDEIERLVLIAKDKAKSKNIIFTGGCAYNTQSHYILDKHFQRVIIPKYPGDRGSSIGAVLAKTKKKLTL